MGFDGKTVLKFHCPQIFMTRNGDVNHSLDLTRLHWIIYGRFPNQNWVVEVGFSCRLATS